jgi:hypothetical protein
MAVAERELRALAESPGVEAVTEVLEPMVARTESGTAAPVPPISTCAGSVTSEGDAQLRAATARTQFNVDGTGTEVGVLSDTFDRNLSASTDAAADIASGDLPGPGNPCGRTTPVDVIDDSSPSGGDEGRGMLQLVHDLAPGSPLAFATAFTGETAFADNIRALANSGAKVIVDDVSYFAEPAFQDGVIAQAVNDVTASGVTYYSSAANNNIISGGKDVASWEAPAFRQATSCPAGVPPYATQCMDFAPGAGSDSTYGFSIAPGRTVRMALHWAQPQQGVTTDLDMYMLIGSTVVARSEASLPASQKPFEIFAYTNNGSSPVNVNIVINRYTIGGGDAGVPRLKLIHLNNGGQLSFPTEYTTSSGGDIVGPAIYGHNGADKAMSSAAVPFNDSSTVEAFSSRGPVTHYFGPVSGTTPAPVLPSPQVLAKPDIAATDGGLTTFFGSGNRFYGTSAAAPHAAAVAALQLDANPAQTVAQVKNAQKTTADPVGAFGPFAVGSGLIDAVGAVPANPPPPPTVAITSPGTTPDPTPSIPFTTTGDVKTQTCSIDSATPQPCSSPFTPSPLINGSHTITVIAVDYFGQTSSDSEGFTVNKTPPDTTITSGPSGPTSNASPSFGFSSSEANSTFKCRIDAGLFTDCTSPKTFTGLAEGPHTFEVRASDQAGNTDQTPATRAFTVDKTPPDTTINSGPTGTITTNQATFTFAGNPSADTAKIQCRIDSGTFADCPGSSKTFTGLTDGPHTVAFRAQDAVGNQDQTPATRSFTVDTTPPDTIIDSGPTGTITTGEATFTFSGNPAGDTNKVQCRIDDQPFADCTSPKTFTALTDGPHTATFRAEDAAGNQDATPAIRSFTVDTTVFRAMIGKVTVKGPAKVKKGKKATYKVKIRNSGNGEATGVRLKVSGRGVSFNASVGKIAAGKSRTVKVKIKPKKTGRVRATFKVTSSNAGGKTVKKTITVRK